MSLHAHPLNLIPELTSQIAHASFPKGTLAMHLRDALGSIYQDADFADLFPKRGRAAEAPWRLALVTVLQALENLSDRQAAMDEHAPPSVRACPSLVLLRSSSGTNISSESKG